MDRLEQRVERLFWLFAALLLGMPVVFVVIGLAIAGLMRGG